MLLLVLLLLLAAGGVLTAAVPTGHPEWGWASVALCALGAVLLALDRARRRRRSAPSRKAAAGAGTAPIVPDDRSPSRPMAEVGAPAEEPGTETSGAGTGWFTPASDGATGQQTPVPGRDDDPAEEGTDAEDLQLVSRLERPVLVVDEHPRYHLAHCGWLGGRRSIPLPVREARELGFTPCARCMPDSTLAYRYRGPA